MAFLLIVRVASEVTNARQWLAAREVLGSWPSTPGEPDRREDILSDRYQSLQPLWLRLHQRTHSEDPQRLATLLFPSVALVTHTQIRLTPESPVSSQWPPDIVSPFWRTKSTEIWWAWPNISKSLKPKRGPGWQLDLAHQWDPFSNTVRAGALELNVGQITLASAHGGLRVPCSE